MTLIKEKMLKDLSLEEIVSCHLSSSPYTVTKDYVVESCLHKLDFAMRQSRGLNSTKAYAPLLMAFSILDQIGGLYSDNKIPAPKANNSIKRALHYFSHLDGDSAEVKAVYALRNGLVHDGALTCQDKDKDWYIFRYDYKIDCIVKLPSTAWSGSFPDSDSQVFTLINPRLFTDLVSELLSKVEDCFQNRKRDFNIILSEDNKHDIVSKYLFWSVRD